MLSLFLAVTCAAPVDGELLRVTDIDGATHQLTEHDATVVVFLKTSCPIANYYHPTLRRLEESWADKGQSVGLLLIHAEAGTTVEKARAHRDDYDPAGVVVVDPAQTLARALEAKVTPEAFVIDRNGFVQYRGRIDDTYIGFGKRRQVVTDRTLADAVDAVLSGRPVKVPKTDAVGCRIHYAD